jgi:selenocysteine-specific elongation factor
VVGLSNGKLRRFQEGINADLARREEVLDDPHARLEYVFASAGVRALSARDAAIAASLTEEQVKEALDASGDRIAPLGESGKWMHEDGWDAAAKGMTAALREFHASKPMRLGMTRVELRDAVGIDSAIYDQALGRALAGGALVEEAGAPGEPPRFRLKSFEPKVTPEDREDLARIEAVFQDEKFQTSKPDDVGQRLNIPDRRMRTLVNLLKDEGVLVEVEQEMIMHKASLEEAVTLARELGAGGAKFKAADFRDKIGTSRKYVIPLLEYLDSMGVTKRYGNERKLIEK